MSSSATAAAAGDGDSNAKESLSGSINNNNNNNNNNEPAQEDERLERAVGLVRVMSSANLKEQCIRTEWASLQTDLERDLLCQVVSERAFWDDVKETANEDLQDAVNEADDEVDVDQRMLQMFKCFDKDGSGSIDATEFHQMLLYMGNPLSDGDVREMMASVDEDGDGAISENEFLHVMKVLLPNKTQGGGATTSSAAAVQAASQNQAVQQEIRSNNAERDELAVKTSEAVSAN